MVGDSEPDVDWGVSTNAILAGLLCFSVWLSVCRLVSLSTGLNVRRASFSFPIMVFSPPVSSIVCRPNGLVASLTILLVQLSTSMSVSESDESPELEVEPTLVCFAVRSKKLGKTLGRSKSIFEKI